MIDSICFRLNYLVNYEHKESSKNVVVCKVVHKQEQGQIKREKLSLIATKQHFFKTFFIILKGQQSSICNHFKKSQDGFKWLTGIKVTVHNWLSQFQIEQVFENVALGNHVLHITQNLKGKFQRSIKKTITWKVNLNFKLRCL